MKTAIVTASYDWLTETSDNAKLSITPWVSKAPKLQNQCVPKGSEPRGIPGMEILQKVAGPRPTLRMLARCRFISAKLRVLFLHLPVQLWDSYITDQYVDGFVEVHLRSRLQTLPTGKRAVTLL